MYQMPADGIIKGVNLPIYEWGTGDQQIMVSLHSVSYPMTADGASYPISAVDGAGWIGGYDMDADGHMTISGTTYAGGGTASVCQDEGAVVAGAQDPLGTELNTGPAGVPQQGLLWPQGFVAATLDPTSNPAGQDNWLATVDGGAEPALSAGDWVGILFAFTGEGDGTADEPTGFYYEAADGLVDPWIFAKFYAGCGGTSGNGGWHIRHWMINAQLAVELTGDRGPVFQSVSALPTTLSTEDRELSVHVTDDNPSGEAAGVSTVTVSYQLDSLTADVNSVSLALADGGTSEDGTWTGSLPGQSPGTTVYWSVTAYDNNANASSSATASYFVFTSTAGNDLVFNNQDRLYGGSDSYILERYMNASMYSDSALADDQAYDLWDASYGGITAELVDNYDLLVELGGHGGPSFVSDAVVSAWWASGSKTYVATGDEWLGSRSGWANGETAQGSVAREILGIAAEFNDVNYGVSGDQGGTSRLHAVEGNAVTGALYTFMQTGHMTIDSTLADTASWDTTYSPVHLNYDPNYEVSSDNWLDGVTPQDGWTIGMTGMSGILDSNGAVGADAEVHNVMIYGQAGNGGKSAFLAFDPMALNTVPSYYWIGAYPYNGGLSPLMSALSWTRGVVSTDQEISLPSEFALKGNYPNPFNPSTSIVYSIGMNSNVNVRIFSLLGEEIATLFNGDVNPGNHEVRWNGVDKSGAKVASGMYIYRVEANNIALTGKMMLMK
jgi:hypothetical protein